MAQTRRTETAHRRYGSEPERFAKHMMIVADLANGNDAIEDALIAAWERQSGT